MPVFFTVAGVSSNKQKEDKGKKAKIDSKDVSYFPIRGKIAVLKPIIDKISITHQISDPELKETLIECLLQEAEQGGQFQSAPKYGSGQIQYKASVNLLVPPYDLPVLIQAGPKKKATSHALRLEFNPSALQSSGIAFLKSALEGLVLDGLNFSEIAANGKITRVDIAVDIVGVGISDLLVSAEGGKKSHWYYSASGKPETGYLGMKAGDKNAKWTTYNKRQQLKDTAGNQLYGGLPHTRIEYRATPMVPFSKLLGLDNPFLKISLAYPVIPKAAKSHEWQFFIDSCARRGQHAALGLLPDGPMKKRYEAALAAGHKTIWRPNLIWKAWEETLCRSGIAEAEKCS
ncbi:hypothetical protein [Afipia sp. DC4300-2b1]|uniref:hypothetical protein n=1 Tax=Afipia sp. DC4300-2b1 TaxID=2804672 RepID=UPI003CE96379